MQKARDQKVDEAYLWSRLTLSAHSGFPTPKWLQFCQKMLEQGYSVRLYEAKQTVSKYITVANGAKSYKVRFSNHKPILNREVNADCDFFVGRANLRTTTTEQAIVATLRFLGSVDATNSVA